MNKNPTADQPDKGRPLKAVLDHFSHCLAKCSEKHPHDSYSVWMGAALYSVYRLGIEDGEKDNK